MSAAPGTAILLMLFTYAVSFFYEIWSYHFLHVVTAQIYFVIKLHRFRFWIRLLCYTFISGVKGIFSFDFIFEVVASGIEKLIIFVG